MLKIGTMLKNKVMIFLSGVGRQSWIITFFCNVPQYIHDLTDVFMAHRQICKNLRTIHQRSLSLHGVKDFQENLQLHEHAKDLKVQSCVM